MGGLEWRERTCSGPAPGEGEAGGGTLRPGLGEEEGVGGAVPPQQSHRQPVHHGEDGGEPQDLHLLHGELVGSARGQVHPGGWQLVDGGECGEAPGGDGGHESGADPLGVQGGKEVEMAEDEGHV